MNQVKKLFSRYGILIILVLMFVFFSIASPAFLQVNNLINVSRQISMLGIAAVGLSFVIITGGIDLSVSSNVALVCIMTAVSMVWWNLGVFPSIVIGILSSATVGAFNGFCVTRLRIPPLITTLATMISVRGLVYMISGGLPIFGFPESFDVFGRGMVGGIPVPVLIMIAVFIVGWFILNKTCYGKYLYAVGGNAEAARLSGINVKKTLFQTYLYSGIFAGIAGIILLSRSNSGQPTAAIQFEMDVISSVVIGGISISGGAGRFTGVIFGVLIRGILNNGLVLLNVNTFAQQFISGFVLLLAVGIDQYVKHRANQVQIRKIAIGARQK